MTHKFYNVTGEGAGGGEIPEEFEQWIRDMIYMTPIHPTHFDLSSQELWDLALEYGASYAYRHLSSSPGLTKESVISLIEDYLIEAYGGLSRDKDGKEIDTPYTVLGIVRAALDRVASPSLPGEQEPKAWNREQVRAIAKTAYKEFAGLPSEFDKWFDESYPAPPSAEKGEQVEGKRKEPDNFCQLLIKARQAKGLSIADAEDRAHIPHGYLAHLEAGNYNQPSAHALYYLAKLYDIELKPLLVAGGVIVKRGQESSPPSVEAEHQVPEDQTLQKIRDWIEANGKCFDEFDDKYDIGFARAAARIINMYDKSMEQARRFDRTLAERDAIISTLRKSGQIDAKEWKRVVDELKAERGEYRKQLEYLFGQCNDILSPDHVKEISKLLNKFTNNTKD